MHTSDCLNNCCLNPYTAHSTSQGCDQMRHDVYFTCAPTEDIRSMKINVEPDGNGQQKNYYGSLSLAWNFLPLEEVRAYVEFIFTLPLTILPNSTYILQALYYFKSHP